MELRNNDVKTAAAPVSQIRYDWQQYEPIDDSASSRIADNALRYLTWGIEYTPYHHGRAISYENSSREIYGSKSKNNYNYKEIIDNWVENNNNNRDKKLNYLPSDSKIKPIRSEISENEVISKVHNLKGLWAGTGFSFMVPIAQNESFPISRIDMFSSENIAWDESRIKTNVSYPSASNKGLSALNDKKMYLKNETENFHIKRENSGTKKTLEAGYEFEQPEQIGGIVLIIGQGSSGVNKARAKFADFKLWNIAKMDSNRNWSNIFSEANKANYRELVYDSLDNNFENFSSHPGRSMGIKNHTYQGFHKDYYTLSSTRLSYVYISFPEPIENCHGIKIIDKNESNDFLEITEMMVFNSDPVSYLTKASSLKWKNIFVQNGIQNTIDAAGSWNIENPPEILNLLNNGKFSRVFNLASDNDDPHFLKVNWIKDNFNIKNIIVWEGNHVTGNSMLTREILVHSSSRELMNSAYFNYDSARHITELRQKIENNMTSPYYNAKISKRINAAGNPIPYAPLGIDSPRTFNYKMLQQVKARNWLRLNIITDGNNENNYLADNYPSRLTTFAEDSMGDRIFNEGYVTELSTWNWGQTTPLKVGPGFLYLNGNAEKVTFGQVSIKPFLPGWNARTEKGYIETDNSPYSIDKIAGVDAMGMFMGAVAMSDISNILNLFNQDIPAELDKYYAMQGVAGEATPPSGLSRDGKPVFHISEGEQSFLNGNYRFNRADFEKNSLLVPDVHEIRKGDFLIKYEFNGEPHIGIVVAILNENQRPAFGEDPTDFMNNIIVVSIRKGFQMVSLGSWGNPGGLFGGFTTDPKAYQIRRLLKLKNDGDLNSIYNHVGWELVEEVPVKAWDGYPSELHIPRSYKGAQKYPHILGQTKVVDGTSYVINSIDNYINYQKAWMIDEGYSHLKNYPPTSYPTIKAKETSPIPHNVQGKGLLWVSCFPGWRSLITTDSWNNRFNFHRGIDIAGPDAFEAPEAGLFWIDHWEDRKDRNGNYIELPNNGGKVNGGDGFPGALGNIGVLVTNSENPQNGRVYLFCHMDDKPQNAIDLYQNLSGGDTYPDSFANGITVRQGKQIVNGVEYNIGYVGTTAYKFQNNQWVNEPLFQHIHLETFEHFDDVQGVEVYSPEEHWLRVDPLSCFYSKEELEQYKNYKVWGSYQFNDSHLLFNKNSGYRQEIYPGQSALYSGLFSDEEAKTFFREWYK